MTSSNYYLVPDQNQNLPVKKPKRRRRRGWSSAAFGLLLAVSGLALARLGHLWIGLDIFSQLFMHFVFLGLAVLLGMAVPRFKGLASSVLFIAMIAAYGIWPHFVSAGPAAPPSALAVGERQLKVASFNTYSENKNTNGIAKEILRLDPDIITLVEFGLDKSVVMDRLNSSYPYEADCYDIDGCDFVILSKFPLTKIMERGPNDGPSYIAASLGPDFGNVTVYGIHTTRFPHSHAQFDEIKQLVKLGEISPGRAILMGDFNATPFSRMTEALAEGWGLSRLTYLPSWSASFGFPQFAIDHIFVSPEIRAISDERIGDNVGSDHYPITMTLAVPTQ